MSEDFVGRPIYSMNEADIENEADFLAGLTQLLMESVPAPVLIAVLVRLDALISSSQANDANGFMLATVGQQDCLSLYICTEDGDEIVESPIPERLTDGDRPKWIINAIQGVANRRNVVTDPVLCQCFCGYGGSPEEWLGVLVPNFASGF